MHPAFWWLIVGTVVLVGAAILRLLERQRQVSRDAEEAALLDAEIRSGKRLPSGHLACRVCRSAQATEPLPSVKVSRYDVHPLRDLHALGAMYELDENENGEKGGCKPCRRMYSKRLDAVLAEKRAQRAIYNAAEAQDIARAEAGALRWAQEQWESNARQIGALFDEAPPPQLPAAPSSVIEVSSESLPPPSRGSLSGEEP
jgi:hypothetical protein